MLSWSYSSDNDLCDYRLYKSALCIMQCACIMHGDIVSSRFHWPCYAELRVNRCNVPVVSRTQRVKISSSHRDKVVSIANFCREGDNSIYLGGIDPRYFSVVVSILCLSYGRVSSCSGK